MLNEREFKEIKNKWGRSCFIQVPLLYDTMIVVISFVKDYDKFEFIAQEDELTSVENDFFNLMDKCLEIMGYFNKELSIVKIFDFVAEEVNSIDFETDCDRRMKYDSYVNIYNLLEFNYGDVEKISCIF